MELIKSPAKKASTFTLDKHTLQAQNCSVQIAYEQSLLNDDESSEHHKANVIKRNFEESSDSNVSVIKKKCRSDPDQEIHNEKIPDKEKLISNCINYIQAEGKSQSDLEANNCCIVEDRENLSGGLSRLEQMFSKDNLEYDKAKVKKRRSSIGKFLGKNCSSPQRCEVYVATQQENVSSLRKSLSEDSNLPLTRHPNKQDAHSAEADNVISQIKAYQEKSKQLEEENRTWKQLAKMRKLTARQAEREFQEAKKGETVIEEEDVCANMNKELAAILSRPNYNQYLQEIRETRVQLVLTKQKMEKMTNICHGFLSTSKFIMESFFSRLEERAFGGLKDRDPKTLLKTMMEINRPEQDHPVYDGE